MSNAIKEEIFFMVTSGIAIALAFACLYIVNHPPTHKAPKKSPSVWMTIKRLKRDIVTAVTKKAKELELLVGKITLWKVIGIDIAVTFLMLVLYKILF